MQPYHSTDMATAKENSYFILSERSDFHWSLTFQITMLALLSVDEILLLRYMNWSTNFRSLPFNEIVFKQIVDYILKMVSV